MSFFKKISKGFLAVIVIIFLSSALGWFFWADIKKIILGDEYYPVAASYSGTNIDKNLKQSIMSKLEIFRQYGEWPILIEQKNPDRGDPFKQKP